MGVEDIVKKGFFLKLLFCSRNIIFILGICGFVIFFIEFEVFILVFYIV